jgi:hypothetical protein
MNPEQVCIARGTRLVHTAARGLEALHHGRHRLRTLRPLGMARRRKVVGEARRREDGQHGVVSI